MKSLFVVSTPKARSTEPPISPSERRKQQRRMGIPRRVVPDRRAGAAEPENLERRIATDRRGAGNRRRRHDRRIGLSPDLDVYLLGI